MQKREEKEKWNLELSLNRLTTVEELAYPEAFKEYMNIATVLLQVKDMYLFEDDLLKDYKTDSIEKILEQYPHILRTNSYRKNEDNTLTKKYLDIASMYFVQPSAPYYDIFFAHYLRQLDLLEIDEFLDYHLEKYYQNNLHEFSRFMRICIRKHGTKLLNPEIIQTANERIETKEKQQQQDLKEKENPFKKDKKGKIKRTANDNLTCLSQDQTVLLIYYLQQERVFLKDEFLKKIEVGTAFEILTGYSQETLRQDLGKWKDNQNKINLKEIDNLLTRVKIAIDKALKEK